VTTPTRDALPVALRVLLLTLALAGLMGAAAAPIDWRAAGLLAAGAVGAAYPLGAIAMLFEGKGKGRKT
jgi:hypothetical protein